jgi:hypothetical protein
MFLMNFSNHFFQTFYDVSTPGMVIEKGDPVDTFVGELLVPEGIIRTVFCVSA